MAIVNTPIGPNSYQFDYSTATTVAEIMTGLDAEITRTDPDNGNAPVHGWELWDGLAGTNQKCYRAKNKDDVTYKYVVLDCNTANILKLKVYENWDNVTHTGTNLCYQSDSASYSGATTTTQPGQIFLFVNPRWLAITTRDPFNGKLNSDPTKQGIFGCFEFTRDNAEDTGAGGTPCFMWLNTSMFYYDDGCGYGPRFKAGATGADAKVELSTILGKTRDTTWKFSAFVPTTKNPWNSKDWALTLYMHEPNFCVRGRVFGLKATTHNAYLILDRIVTKCDEDYMYSSTGTDTEHHIVHCSVSTSQAQQFGRVIIPV